MPGAIFPRCQSFRRISKNFGRRWREYTEFNSLKRRFSCCSTKERAYRIMEKYEVEAIIAAMPENVTYLTDFWSLSHWILKGTPTFAVLPRDGKIEPFIATPISELDQAAMGEGDWSQRFQHLWHFLCRGAGGRLSLRRKSGS